MKFTAFEDEKERCVPLEQRFIILTRWSGQPAARLRDILGAFGKVEIIPDDEGGDGVWYADAEVRGFEGLMGASVFPPLTAWSRAMYHLSRTVKDNEVVWLVEDDVAGGAVYFEALITLTEMSGADLAARDINSRERDPAWNFWHLGSPWFEAPWRAFQPLCRVSARLIQAALEFRKEQGRFTFHEVLFPSLAAREGMSILDWNRSAASLPCFGSFGYRPLVKRVYAGISHPVKDEQLHGTIMGVNPPTGPLLPHEPRQERWAPIDGSCIKFGSKPLWSHHTPIINDVIGMTGAQRYLEIGCGDGRHFAAVRCAEKVSVDPAKGSYATAQPTHRMTSDEFFTLFARSMEKFDVIFIDGLHTEEQVARDLRNALAYLNPGGVVLCHDLNPTSEAMQEVPRRAGEWTGDGWKAWMRLRAERPDLTMLVVEADYGVGVILHRNRADSFDVPALTKVQPAESALTWAGLVAHRQEWLNLMTPEAARDRAISHFGDKPPLTVVTLWRAGWSEAQQRVLDWLCTEPFPDDTVFFWTVQAGSDTAEHLETAWTERLEPMQCRAVELLEVPCSSPSSETERHTLIAGLYTEVLSKVVSDTVLLVEDDVVPPSGSAAVLIESLAGKGRDTAAVMGAYRSRQRPEFVCAHDLRGRYIPWADLTEASAEANPAPVLIPAAWIGGGLTGCDRQIMLS